MVKTKNKKSKSLLTKKKISLFLKNKIKNKKLIIVLSGFILTFILVNQFYSIKIVRKSKSKLFGPNIKLGDFNSEDLIAARSYVKFKKIKASFVPSGVPDIYGEELDISFDKVQDAIDKVRIYGPTYGKDGKKIILTGDDLERYKKIGALTACKYCCGVRTLVKKDGTAACGCAHSTMMRGLAAYLIKNHPDVSDEWILDELNKWRRTYFPKQTLSAELIKMEKSGEPGIKEILGEFPDFLPQMVGGC